MEYKSRGLGYFSQTRKMLNGSSILYRDSYGNQVEVTTVFVDPTSEATLKTLLVNCPDAMIVGQVCFGTFIP